MAEDPLKDKAATKSLDVSQRDSDDVSPLTTVGTMIIDKDILGKDSRVTREHHCDDESFFDDNAGDYQDVDTTVTDETKVRPDKKI